MSIPINQIPVRASALTYTTILSFVPLAVILSAVAGHFGYLGLLSKSVITLSDSMNLDIDLDPILNLINQVQSVDFHRLGLVGSLGLLVTFFLSMSNIELAMDQIWDIHKKRNWWTRIKEFTPFLIILILLVLGAGNFLVKYRSLLESKFTATGMNGFVHHTILLFNVFAIVAFLWLGLFMVFYIIPNTKVRLFPAVLAATLASTGLYFLSRALSYFPQLFFSKSNFIYGSLAIVPALLLLIYLLWLIVLYGAAVGFIYQRLYYSRDKTSDDDLSDFEAFHQMEKEVMSVLLAMHKLSGSKKLEGRRVVTLQQLTTAMSEQSFIAEKSSKTEESSRVEQLAAPLVNLGLLSKRNIQSGPVYYPQKSLEQVDLTAIHNMLLRLDSKGNGKLRTLTAIDELNQTLGILYSSGKLNPPMYFGSLVKYQSLEKE